MIAAALLAVVAVGIIAVAALTGNLNLFGQKTYPMATVSGKITGQAFTEGGALGVATSILLEPVGAQSQAKGFSGDVKADGSYSITVTNGINYTVFISVTDPNNNSDTGLCQGQTVVLNSPQNASYVFDMTPVNCG